MKIIASAPVLSMAFAVVASAQYVNPIAPDAVSSSANSAATRGVPVYSENFEAFELGQLPPQNGWSSQFDLNARVTDVNPISGQRSVRHVSDGTSVPGFELRSPMFDAGFVPVTSTVRLSGMGSTYQIAPRDLTFGTFNTRVSFDPDGAVRVGQAEISDFGVITIDFIDTGFNWLVDTDYVVSIESFADGSLTVGIDGNQIFSGLENTFVTLGIPGEINQFNIFAGNEGSGSVDGSGDTLTLDDLFVGVPAPGVTGLVGVAGIACARRRRDGVPLS